MKIWYNYKVREIERERKMQKESNIYLTITNNVVNFKIRLPWDWCKRIGITEEEKAINIKIANDCLVIDKENTLLFSDLKTKDKIKQLKKFELLYRNDYDKQKDFIKKVEEYFKISYRTAYRRLQTDIDLGDLDNVKLVEEQEEFSRNVNLMLKSGVEQVTATLSIPSALAIKFLKGKTSEELGIKNIIEIYDKNMTLPITLRFDNEKIYIEKNKNTNY